MGSSLPKCCALILSMILVEKATAENCLSCDRVVECLASMRATRDLPCRHIVHSSCVFVELFWAINFPEYAKRPFIFVN